MAKNHKSSSPKSFPLEKGVSKLPKRPPSDTKPKTSK
jgi:hypothetical protein